MILSPVPSRSSLPDGDVVLSEKARGKRKMVDRGTQTDTATQSISHAPAAGILRAPQPQKLKRALSPVVLPSRQISRPAASESKKPKRTWSQACRAYYAKKKAAFILFWKHDDKNAHRLGEHYEGRALFPNV